MKILKYSKKGSNKYLVHLENNTTILLYEDVILKNDLLLKKEIDDINDLIRQNKKYEILDVAMKYISLKMRSVNEVFNYLKKANYDDIDINNVINYLLEKGYLNDGIYAYSYIVDRLNLSLDGPKKIINYLNTMNIEYSLYAKHLSLFTNDIIENRINKVIAKMIKVNKKSKVVLKNKITAYLINLGYEIDDINKCLQVSFCVDDSLNREAERLKIYNRLKRKYSGAELDRKVSEKLYQRGYFS